MKKSTLIVILLSLPFSLYAVDKNPIAFETPEQEQQYSDLIEELRCVVCQNQSVGDSNAELAQDVRNLVREKIQAGETTEQITDFMVERYGDFVLYNPPLKTKTVVLWIGPIVLVLIAFLMLVYFIRRHANTTVTSPDLTDDERQKLTQALGNKET
ncbi:MAG: cytochrome c-type biogenesis protein CcmH [Thiomargarita sp.]|nr:cytochrome c-type biogenesis protein CcmH [Thiomargarita sp.]